MSRKFVIFLLPSVFILHPEYGHGAENTAAESRTRGSEAAPTGSVTSSQEAKRNPPKRISTPGKRPSKRRLRCRSWSTPEYRAMKRRWQRRPDIPKPRYRDGFRDLAFYSVNHRESTRVFPFLSDGYLDPESMDEIAYLFRDKDTGGQRDIHPRLVKLLYRLADQFKARQIIVISGFRESTDSNGEGNHSRGRAVDFTIPGVGLVALARKARELGHVGVGIYPVSGFVHMDVRDGPSYFWIDRSGPGQRSCLRRLLPELAPRYDRKWRSWHDEPKRRFYQSGKPFGAVSRDSEETSVGSAPAR